MYDIIVNPSSQSGRGKKLWEQTVKPALDGRGLSYRVHFSRQAGDVSRLARDLTGKRNVILLGGDGTLNEFLQGAEHLEDLSVGYIPAGSSNDLARDIHISKNPAKALERILSGGRALSLDIGEITFPDGSRRRFAVSCGAGFDAAVCEESNRSGLKKKLNRIGLGKLVYLGIALKQLLGAGTVSCRLTLDGHETVKIPNILFLAAMIHRYEGGGFQFCPKADCSDGLLDLCLVENLPKWLILAALPTAYFGKHYLFHGIRAYRARKLHIMTSSPLWVHTDGEVPGAFRECTVECLQGKLRMIV